MKTVKISNARAGLFNLVHEVLANQDRVEIESKEGKVSLISSKELSGLEETLQIYMVPGLVEQILEAANTPKEELISYEDFKW